MFCMMLLKIIIYSDKEFCIMSDNIHVVVCILPPMSVSKALLLLKDASARELFKRRTYFKYRYPLEHFWSPGKFY